MYDYAGSEETEPMRGAPKNPNHKGKLQEQADKQHWGKVLYDHVGKIGQPHAQEFTVEATIVADGISYAARGIGNSKKEAEQNSALLLLQKVPISATKSTIEASLPENPISILNEMKQLGELKSSEFSCEEAGSVYDRSFTCLCIVTTRHGCELKDTAQGKTKQGARRAAASKVLDLLVKHGHGGESMETQE